MNLDHEENFLYSLPRKNVKIIHNKIDHLNKKLISYRYNFEI